MLGYKQIQEVRKNPELEAKRLESLPGKGFHKYPDGRSIDHIRVQEMENAGYRVIRFWEGEFDAKSIWREI